MVSFVLIQPSGRYMVCSMMAPSLETNDSEDIFYCIRKRKWSLAAADTKKDRSLSKAEGKIVTDCDLNSL